MYSYLLTALFSLSIVQAEEIPVTPGDVNRDGNVDFQDFVLLAQNFGKTGPPPTDLKPDTVTVRDTIVFIEHHDINKSERLNRAERFLGFWHFTYGSSDLTSAFAFGFVEPESEVKPEEELTVIGTDEFGNLCGGSWSTERKRYTIVHRLLPNSALNYFEFLIDEKDRVVGEMYWITDGTALSLGEFSADSGKWDGKGSPREFDNNLGKKAILEPPSGLTPASPEVQNAFEELYGRLVEKGIF